MNSLQNDAAMIRPSRRMFLGGALALTLARSIPGSKDLPLIMGDGQHDDANGLNALMRGDPVSIMHSGVHQDLNGSIWIEGGHFLISRPVVLKPYTSIRNCTMTMLSDSHFLQAASHTSVDSCLLIRGQV